MRCDTINTIENDFDKTCKQLSENLKKRLDFKKIMELVQKNALAKELMSYHDLVSEIRKIFRSNLKLDLSDYKVYIVLLNVENLLRNDPKPLDDSDLVEICGGNTRFRKGLFWGMQSDNLPFTKFFENDDVSAHVGYKVGESILNYFKKAEER